MGKLLLRLEGRVRRKVLRMTRDRNCWVLELVLIQIWCRD